METGVLKGCHYVLLFMCILQDVHDHHRAHWKNDVSEDVFLSVQFVSRHFAQEQWRRCVYDCGNGIPRIRARQGQQGPLEAYDPWQRRVQFPKQLNWEVMKRASRLWGIVLHMFPYSVFWQALCDRQIDPEENPLPCLGRERHPPLNAESMACVRKSQHTVFQKHRWQKLGMPGAYSHQLACV